MILEGSGRVILEGQGLGEGNKRGQGKKREEQEPEVEMGQERNREGGGERRRRLGTGSHPNSQKERNGRKAREIPGRFFQNNPQTAAPTLLPTRVGRRVDAGGDKVTLT